MTIALLSLICLFAAAFSTIAGFGAGIIFITFASTMMEIKQVIPISTAYFLALALTQTIIFRRHIDRETVKLYCYGALPGILLGMVLFHVLPGEVTRRLIAVLVIGWCVNALLKLVPERRPGSRVTAAISFVTGMVDAVTASGGTIQAPLFLARGLRKESFVASFAATAVLLNPLKVAIYCWLGHFELTNLPLVGLLVVAGFAGVQLGRLGLTRLTPESFRRIAIAFLFVLGLKLLR